MKRVVIFGMLLFSLSTNIFAADYIFSGGVPTEVHLVPNGMVLLGTFHDTTIKCATGANAVQAIYIPKTASNFDAKLSFALTAQTAKKEIKVLIDKISAAECVQISAMGFVAVAYDYYFQLRN